MRNTGRKPLFFRCKPLLRPDGLWYVRFYSRHPYPWYQASILVERPQDSWNHFEQFKKEVREHMKSCRDSS